MFVFSNQTADVLYKLLVSESGFIDIDIKVSLSGVKKAVYGKMRGQFGNL